MDAENIDIEFEKEASPEPRQMKLIFKLLIGLGAGLIASGLGLFLPVVRVVSMFALFMAVFVGLWVFGGCDWQGLGAYMLTMEACALISSGVSFGVVTLLILILPLAVMAVMDMRGVEFFKRLYLSLAVELVGMLMALGFIVLVYQKNLGDLATELLKNNFAAIPDSTKNLLASYYKELYSAMGVSLKYETGEELLNAVAESCGDYIKEGLPAVLLLFASLNVLPGVKLESYIRSKRGLPKQTDEPLRAWRMSEQFIWGIILLLVTGIILNFTAGAGGRVVLSAVLTLAVIACAVQTLASFADRFGQAPVPRGFKIVMAVMIFLFFTQLIPFYGGLSMIIGSHGLVSKHIKRPPSMGDDDFDE